jgi:hypothetical protein
MEEIANESWQTEADNEPLSLLMILESNGLNDAIWCLRACDVVEKEARLYAVACARRVQHLMQELCSINALDVAERYANGQATDAELATARDATRGAAWYAASATARGAAEEAAWYAAEEAAWYAADAAAWDTARAVETEWQETEFRRVFCS